MVVEETIFFILSVYFVNSLLSPIGKERDPSFEQTLTPFTQEFFVSSLVTTGQVVLEKKVFKFRQCFFSTF